MIICYLPTFFKGTYMKPPPIFPVLFFFFRMTNLLSSGVNHQGSQARSSCRACNKVVKLITWKFRTHHGVFPWVFAGGKVDPGLTGGFRKTLPKDRGWIAAPGTHITIYLPFFFRRKKKEENTRFFFFVFFVKCSPAFFDVAGGFVFGLCAIQVFGASEGFWWRMTHWDFKSNSNMPKNPEKSNALKCWEICVNVETEFPPATRDFQTKHLKLQLSPTSKLNFLSAKFSKWKDLKSVRLYPYAYPQNSIKVTCLKITNLCKTATNI